MDNNSFHSRGRHKSSGIPPSPRLLRCRSGSTPAISLPENYTNTPNSSLNSVQRSKSTTRSIRTTTKGEENLNPLTTSPRIQKKPISLHSSTSPSAWALSPGRSSPSSSPVPKSPSSSTRAKTGGGGGGVSGVLKYFRQKKVSRVKEEEFVRVRVLHNRLLQWRFVNARAEAAMNAVRAIAEDKLFNVWVRVFILRKSNLEKRIQIEKLEREIKLYEIVNPQICLLKEWAKMESRNSEAVGRLVRKLSAISIRLPLVQGAKANVESVLDTMSAAMEVMFNIEATITKFLSQVERTCYLLTELVIMMKQHEEYSEKLEERISIVSSLEAEEIGLRVHLISVAGEQSSRFKGY